MDQLTVREERHPSYARWNSLQRVAALLIVSLALLFSTNPVHCQEKSHSSSAPNIVMIFVDDMGYGDPGCYGGRDIPTPNIDRLAAGGVRFTDGYVTAAVCGPSRMGLLTGAYQQRFGCFWNEDLWAKYELTLPDSHKLMPQALAAAGYKTGQVGKWNITPDPRPYVDEAFAVMNWKGAYYPDENGVYLGVDGPDFRMEPHGWGPPRPGAEYLTDRLTRHAVDFLDRHAEKPFFLYLAYNAPHTPLQADKKYDAQFKHLEHEPNRLYAGMVASLDENLGRVLDKLRDAGLEENTLVALVSDNGPARGSNYLKGWRKDWPKETLLGSADPLSGHKAKRREGGIRVPFLLRWPAQLQAGQVYEKPVSTLDLYPTFCAATAADVPEGTHLDGVNLLPYLTSKESGEPHDMLFWKPHAGGAVRQGRWKLLIESWGNGKVRLFDLENDLAEANDLASKKPELTEQLHQAWLDWSEAFPTAASKREKSG